MSDTPKYPALNEGHEDPYFPPLYGMPECEKCERKRTCFSRDKFQRNFRDFSYTSGRCPRLPDKSGRVEADERTLYNSLFPLVHAEQGEDKSLTLTLFLPNQARGRRVNYSTAFKRWWVRMRTNGWTQRRFLKIENFMQNSQSILDYMAFRNSDHCIFRCEIEDNWF